MKKTLAVCVLCLYYLIGNAQTNLDFELGNFTGWTGRVGYTSGIGQMTAVNSNTIWTKGVNSDNYVQSYHTIMTGGTDPFGGFPRVSTSGGVYSARLGNMETNVNIGGDCYHTPTYSYMAPGMTNPNAPYPAGAESLEQSFVVNTSNAMITLQYAAVFNTGSHSGTGTVNPWFRAEVLNSSGASISSCLTYTFVLNTTSMPAGSGTSGATNCNYGSSPTESVVVYMPWQRKLFDLTSLTGQSVTVRFSAGGCDEGGHFGYAYFDAAAGPKDLIQSGGSGCSGPIKLTGPTQYGSTYSWSGPAGGITASSANSATVNTTGTYSLTVGSGPCALTFTTAVNLTTPIIAAVPSNQSICSGGSVSAIGFNASPSGATINWVNTNTVVGISASGSGDISSYTAPTVASQQVAYVTGTPSLGGCTGPAKTFTITINPYPNLSVSSNTTITCSNTIVPISGSSSIPGTTYSWSPNGSAPTSTITNVSSAGTYTLKATLGSCSTSSIVTVLSNQVLPDANGSTSTTLTCLTTTATLTGSSLTSGVSYSWAPGGSTPTSSTTGVTAAGTYSLIVTDPSNGCKKTATVTVSANTQTPQVTTSTNNLSCLTTTTTISATSTVSPVGYTWTGPGITSATTISTITINQGGTYNYTVSNTSTGCKTTGALSITSNTALPTATATGGSLTCVATTATLTGGPSTGVTYSWSGTGLTGPTNTTTATATSTGSYTLVTTSTTNGCTNTAVAMIGSNTTPPQINIGGDLTLTCNIPTVTLNGSSTTSGVTYSWTTGGSTPTSSTTVVSSPGIYTLTVTDPSNGCKSSLLQSVLSHTIQPNLSIGSTQTITCANTSVTLTGSSTTSGVTYSWSPGVSTPTSAITTATTNGTYSLTVTDPGNSCKTTSVVTVLTNTTTPTSTSTVSGVLNCTLTTVNASATTTTTPVSYTWTGTGITSTTNTNTIAANQLGNFNYTITNTTNGCTTTGSQTITQNIITPSVTASGTQTITCASPSVSLTGSATPANSIPVWTGGACSGVNTYTATACSPNTYTLTVTDPSNGCTNTALVDVVPSVGVPSVTATNSGSITCSTTTAEITASTAMTPVSYSWSGPGAVNGSTTPSGTVTVGGTYQCVVTNTNTGCTSTVTTIVPTNTTTVTANATTTSSITCTTTSINITATPGGSNYGYIWTGPGTITNNTTENPTVDAGGDYTVTIIDNTNGCTGTANVNVPTNTVVPTLTLSPSSLTTTCANPTATLSATSSSDPDATYTWTVPSTGTLNNTNSSNPVANGSGIFTVQVTNTVSGCVSATETVSMTADANTPVLNATATNTIICEGNTSTLNITGADTYTWSTTETTTTITVTPNQTTTYTVAGTNTLTGCSNFTNITVNVTPTPTIGISTTAMTICEGSNTTLTLTGATSYTITNPSQTTTNTITVSPTTQTTYTVIGESSNCTSPTQTITINVNTLPQLSVPNQTTCAGSPVTLTANGADTYTWSTTETTNTIAPTPGANTTYTVTGTNTLTGCTSTITTVDVTVNALPTVTATANPNTTCTTGTVNLTASTTATSYTWTTGNGITGSNQNTQSPSFPASTLNTGTYTYTLQVTDANGCISPQATATLNVIDVPNANFDLSNLNICQNANGTISINTPQSGVTYDWNINGQTITNTNPLTVPTNITNTVGTYTVSTIASIGTCSNTAANTLTVNALPNITLVNPTASACENTSTHLDIAGPNSTYNYAWTNGQSTATGPTLNADPLTQTNAGTYTVTATDQNGCSNRTTGVIDAQICQTYIPEIFTPNGDGKNDGFVIKNIENYPNNKLKIFNRWGNKVYEKDGYLNEFEGYANTGDQVGKSKLPAGTYYVILEYGDNKTETYNGYLLLQY